MDLIIHHKDCPDGFCAGFVAKKKYPEASLRPKNHGESLPLDEVTGLDVLVVDFSWRTKEDNRSLRDAAKSFQILDHHKTAQETLQGEPYATFDMDRSGAGITWDVLFPDTPRPWYVNYVEDRDLWRHQLPDSKEVNAYIMTLPHTIEAWNALDTMTAKDAIVLGKGALAQINHYVEKAVAQRQTGFLNGKSAAIINAQYMNISEAAGELCNYADIGIGYFERGDAMIQFSLRSRSDLDVSEIAKSFGGGGHKNAAGFQVSYKKGREVVDTILGRL